MPCFALPPRKETRVEPTPSDLADANLIESVRQHARWQQPCEWLEADGLLMVAGANAMPYAYRNCAIRVDPDLPATETMTRVRAFFGERQRHFTMFTRDGRDADLVEPLPEHPDDFDWEMCSEIFFQDEDVRKGFAYSFDQDVMIDELFLGNGSRLTMALPPSFLGYDDTVPTYEYDPEQAEEHFRQAYDGELWDTGFELTIAYNTGNQTRQTIAEILKANVEALNPDFTVNVRGVQWPDFLEAYQESRQPISLLGWAPDYADPDNYIHTFYHSEGVFGGAYGYDYPEIDRLIEDARQTTNAEEREFYYNQVGRLAYEEVPLVPYPSADVFIVTREDVEGVYYNPMLSHEYQWKHITKN
jgi:ABC-type transport system substrate-binding protein